MIDEQTKLIEKQREELSKFKIEKEVLEFRITVVESENLYLLSKIRDLDLEQYSRKNSVEIHM